MVIKILFVLLFLPCFLPKSVFAVDVGRYDVFEETITHTQPANPWEDANGSYVTADFISPTKTINIEGFYYDTNTYKVRFTPAELGTYTYNIYWRGSTTPVKSGSFNSVPSANHGFIRQSQVNKHRFVFEDGTFFNGVGLNDCWGTPSEPQWYMKAAVDWDLGIDKNEKISIAGWIKYPTGDGSTDRVIVSKMGLGPQFKGYYLAVNNTNTSGAGRLEFRVVTDMSINKYLSVLDSRSINDNLWHHFAVTYNGTGSSSGVKFYVDGVLNSSNTVLSSTLDTAAEFWHLEPFQIGAVGNSNYLLGTLDELEVFGVELSQSEINLNFNKGKMINSPMGSWYFEDGSGNVAGRFGQGKGFNGTTDKTVYVTWRGPDQYFQTYGASGFNLFRWNPGNCSFGIWGLNGSGGNTYLKDEGKSGDLLLSSAKKYGFHSLFTFWWGPPSLSTTDPVETGKMKRAINYAIARYGAYIDMWEMTNEQDVTTTSKTWLKYYTDYVRSRDPYKRLITNSHPIVDDWFWDDQRGDRTPLLDFRSPHPEMYDGYTILNSATNGFTTNSPVIVGEGYTAISGCGNCAYNPVNPLSVRGTVWSSVMSGLGVIWWNSSYGLCSGCMPHNEYLGFKERAGVKIAQDLFKTMDKDAQMEILNLSNGTLTGYKLGGPSQILIYIFKNWNDSAINKSTSFQTNIPFSGTARWIDPATGNVLSTSVVTAGTNSFTPSFAQDIALRITSSGTPVAGDLNGDGKVDILDFRQGLKSFNSIFNLLEILANFGK